ncbi:FkbM family methyltransferase [Roseicella aquatilis]|nr:FkbM family methyltransferase [Roseicella aquatilis]
MGEAEFTVLRHPLVDGALHEFRSESEAGTRQFFDAVLPGCDTMVDVGAHVGLTTLYVAGRVARVTSLEPSPVSFAFLARNMALNPGLREKVRLLPLGLSDRDEHVTLYAKGFGDSGSSIHERVERAAVLRGYPLATVPLRSASAMLHDIGLTPRTLLKIDIEGAEYRVVPALAGLTAEAKPFLHLSFHPFNLAAGGDTYETALLRLGKSLEIASALAHYASMYFYDKGRWIRIGRPERMDLLRQYLLAPKRQPPLATPQYGFVEAVGFSDIALPALDA